jgi:hypothetical protein
MDERGARITQAAVLFQQDIFRAVALLSVPFLPRGPLSPSQWEQQLVREVTSCPFGGVTAVKVYPCDVLALQGEREREQFSRSGKSRWSTGRVAVSLMSPPC